MPDKFWRGALILIAMAILLAVYLFQRLNLIGPGGLLYPEASAEFVFITNRVIRMTLNDFACLLLIYALFRESTYLKIGFFVFLAELLVILPVYLLLKLRLEGDSEISSPLLSLIHRLIVNPMLMFLLIAGFFYQMNLRKRNVE